MGYNDSRSGGRDGGNRGRDGGRGGGDRFGGNRSFNNGPREMHKAKCAECGQDCEVPFKPSGDKPVYCRDCYNKKRGY